MEEARGHFASLVCCGVICPRHATHDDSGPRWRREMTPAAASALAEHGARGGADSNLVRERRVAVLAGRQHGVVTRAQLLVIGLSRSAIDRRLHAGRLHALHRGVFAVGHAKVAAEGRLLAATFAAGEGSAISHATAADLHGLRPSTSPSIHVVSPRNVPTRPGIVGHRSRDLPADEITVVRGIPVVSVARTLVQLASTVDGRSLARAWRRAVEMRTLDARQLARQLDVGRPGSVAIRRLLAEAADGGLDGTVRSELELLFVELVAAAGLAIPRLNVPLELRGRTYEVDALWSEARLVVEVDGWSVHSGRQAFEADRRRDAELVRSGYRVVRFTWRRIVDDPRGVAVTLRDLLAG